MFLEDTGKARRRGEGSIEVICGSMFSGKTEELLRRLKRAKIAKQKIEVFKPEIDTRYDEEEVVSHDRNAELSTPVPASEHILLMVSADVDVVGIDEAQFFDDNLPHVCNELANQGMRVIIAGLDMDFQGRPFGPMPYLMAIAEYVTKVHAICVRTGKLANYSHRISGGSETVELGERDRYEPLSRAAYLPALEEEKNKKAERPE
ncbi:MAG: thymidine kinase [Cryomorphaceae bacterium]|nr:thymidine kinase [Flavobacteriales bacterium]